MLHQPLIRVSPNMQHVRALLDVRCRSQGTSVVLFLPVSCNNGNRTTYQTLCEQMFYLGVFPVYLAKN